jgi:phage terminase small subunit
VLTKKRRAFVEEYLRCWNATEAARRAGYSDRTARSQGQRLLTYVDIQDLVKARLAEKAMSADEVLTRLASMARAEYTDYLREDGTVDLDAMLKDGKGHLIKGTKWDRQGNLVVEFYDAHAALVDIGKHLRLFSEQYDVNLQGKLDTYTRLLNNIDSKMGDDGEDDEEQLPAQA